MLQTLTATASSSSQSHLPSPSPNHTPKPRKRQRSSASTQCSVHSINNKRARAACAEDDIPYTHEHQETDPLAHWVEHHRWAQYQDIDPESMSLPSKKRDASQSRSTSVHWSQRYRELAQFGIHTEDRRLLRTDSRQFCERMLEERFQQVQYSNIPPEKFLDMSDRAQFLNENRIQRDITPWVLPSPELLHLWDVQGLQDLREELNAEWIQCSAMGWKRPKPDVTIGLSPSTFDREEQCRLQAHAMPDGPFYFTANICFPFLVCEAKSGRVGLNEADGQNLHSAAIAVRAIFQLASRAWGWKSERMMRELDAQVLVFSISHDVDCVYLSGHFAVCEDANDISELHYYRHSLRLLSLKAGDGFQRLVSYNFVRNLYDHFVPKHVARLRAAVADLPTQTALSLVPSMPSDGADDDGDACDADTASEGSRGRKQVRREPSSAAMVTMRNHHAQLMEQLAQRTAELAQQREDSAKQLAQQREDSAKHTDRLSRIIELLQGQGKR